MTNARTRAVASALRGSSGSSSSTSSSCEWQPRVRRAVEVSVRSKQLLLSRLRRKAPSAPLPRWRAPQRQTRHVGNEPHMVGGCTRRVMASRRARTTRVTALASSCKCLPFRHRVATRPVFPNTHLLVNRVKELHLGLESRSGAARGAAPPLAGRVCAFPAAVVAPALPKRRALLAWRCRRCKQRPSDSWLPADWRLAAPHAGPRRALRAARVAHARPLGCCTAVARRAGRHTLACERQQRRARCRHGALGRGRDTHCGARFCAAFLNIAHALRGRAGRHANQLNVQGDAVRIRGDFVAADVVVADISRHKHRTPPTLTHALHRQEQRRRRFGSRCA